MNTQLNWRLTSAIAFSLLLLGGCNSSSSSDDDDAGSTDTTEDTSGTDTGSDGSSDTGTGTDTDSTNATALATGQVVLSNFVSNALTSYDVVDCTLSDGTETECYELVSTGKPAGQTPGPFCPETINDNTADGSGMWLDDTGVDGTVELTGSFIQDLAAHYGDSNWKLYDETTGNIFVTDTQESCEGAAQPNVEEQYQNHCVQCEMEYLDNGVMSATYLIPVTPHVADTTGNVSQVGVALNGTELSAPAPLDDILGNYTIAAFDDCGGHINTHQGYHYHAATDCAAVGTQSDAHAALIGYALDGYGIYANKDSDGNEADGLDECRGQTDDVRGYHYHAASAGENVFIGCFHGKTVESTDAGGPPAGGPPGGPTG